VDDLLEHRKISASTRASLEQHFSTQQIMDIVAIQGMYMILGSMIDTWSLPLDEGVAVRIEGVTQLDTFRKAAALFSTEAR